MKRREPESYSLGGGWPEPHVAFLRKCWAEAMSGGECAKALRRAFPDANYSRNAIIGKANRIGLGGRATPRQPARVTTAFKPTPRLEARVFGETKVPLPAPRLAIAGNGTVFETAPTIQEAALKSDAWAPLPDSSPVLLEERLAFQCKWPVDVPGEDIPRSCGCPAPGARYCVEHDKRAFAPSKQRATATDLYRKYRRVA